MPISPTQHATGVHSRQFRQAVLKLDLIAIFAMTILGLSICSSSVVAQSGDGNGTDKRTPPESYRIEIEDDQWIEFQAVSTNTDDDDEVKFWFPDGRLRDAPGPDFFSTRGTTKSDHFRREFWVKAFADKNVHFSLEADRSTSGGSQTNDQNGRVESLHSQVAEYPDGSKAASVRLKVAAGPWKTIATGSQAGGVQRGVEFLRRSFRVKNPPMMAVVSQEIADKSEVRMIAEDSSHNLYFPQSWGTGGSVNGVQVKATFAQELLETALRFHIQTREWAVLEFRNVALHEGNKSQVEILLNGEEIDVNDVVSLRDLIVNPPQPLRVQLDEAGTYTELTGITDSTDPDKWWGADGNDLLLDRKPQFSKSSDESRRDTEFVWTTHFADSVGDDAFVMIDENVTRTMMRKPIVHPDGSRTIEHIGTGSVLKRGVSTTDVVVRFAGGEWNDVAELPVREKPYTSREFRDWIEGFRSQPASESFVIISSSRENVEGKKDWLTTTVIFHEDEAFQYRLVAKQKDGTTTSSPLTSGLKDVRYAGFGLALSSVHSYMLQRRPYRIGKFRNVSLHRNHPTSSFVVPPTQTKGSEDDKARQPRSRVLRTFAGDIITLPRNEDLEKRLAEMQRRGAYLNFEPASRKIINEIKKLNESRVPDHQQVANPDDLVELSFLRWRDVPGDELHMLRGIAGLEQMSLTTKANGTDLAVLADFSDLRELRLKTGNDSPEVFVALGHLQSLEKLTLDDDFQVGRRGFEARHLLPLRNLRKMKHLSLSGVDFTDEMLSHLSSLTELTFLYTGNSVNVTDLGLSHLKNLDKLDGLVLHRIMATDEGLKFLAEKPELEWLEIPSDRYTDAGMEHLASMPKLGRVNLSGSQVTDAGVETLAKAPKLREVNLLATRVTQAGIDILKEAHPKIEVRWQESRRAVDPEEYKGLAFRLIPKLGEESDVLTLTRPHVEALKSELDADGPLAARKRQQHFQWFRLSDDEINVPITHNHQGQRYGLLVAQSDWIMRSFVVQPKLERVALRQDENSEDWLVVLVVSNRDGDKIKGLTQRFLNFQVAVTIDNEVLIAPKIQTVNRNEMTIDGGDTKQEAENLAKRIAGAARLELEMIEQ